MIVIQSNKPEVLDTSTITKTLTTIVIVLQSMSSPNNSASVKITTSNPVDRAVAFTKIMTLIPPSNAAIVLFIFSVEMSIYVAISITAITIIAETLSDNTATPFRCS